MKILIPLITIPLLYTGILTAKVVSPASDDRRIHYAVERQLLDDHRIFSNDIDVAVEDGVVRIEGFVENLPSKRLTTNLAKEVYGTRSVVNQLIVRPVERSDEDILTDVRFALQAQPGFNGSVIEAHVNDGIVRLTGETTAFAMRELSEDTAARVAGVRGILMAVHVKPGEERSESELTQHIWMKLAYAPWFDPGRMNAMIEGSEVTLSGKVQTLAQLDRLRAFVAVHGVTNVLTRNIDFDSRPPRKSPLDDDTDKPDGEIEAAVEAALEDDYRVAEDGVRISVTGGVVSLDGYVSSIGSKRVAEADARATKGAGYVYNYLKIRPRPRLPDSNLKEAVEGRLRSDTWLWGQTISVSAKSGRVTLRGMVEDEFRWGWAEDLVSMISGVVEVRNAMRIDFESPEMIPDDDQQEEDRGS
ncbi:MAG: osmotically-inducible protein OsmY [Pirellulaceae bacterium]|jgi:osmotically-inducible protein OsmY